MEPEVRYTFVGAVLVGLVVALIAGALWIGGVGMRERQRSYDIYFVRQSLDGLQVGASVNMRGIKVGQVDRYVLSRDEVNRVRVTIRVDRDTPVAENTVAVVARNLVTGLARIDLVTPDPPGAALVSPEGGIPVIAEGTSRVERIEDAATRIALEGTTALARVNDLLDDANRRAFAEALENLRDLTDGLNKRLAGVDRALVTISRSAEVLGQSARSVAASADRVAAEVPPLARQADATLLEVSASARALEQQVTTLARRVDAATSAGALELRATTQELRVAADALERAMHRLRDPRGALLGPKPEQFGPGESSR